MGGFIIWIIEKEMKLVGGGGDFIIDLKGYYIC